MSVSGMVTEVDDPLPWSSTHSGRPKDRSSLRTQRPTRVTPKRQTRDDQTAGGDHGYRHVDTLAAVPGPIHILEVEQQRELVDDERRRRPVGKCGSRMVAVLIGSAQPDGTHHSEQGDADVVVVKMLTADAHTTTRGTVTIPDPMRQRTQPHERRGECSPGQHHRLLA